LTYGLDPSLYQYSAPFPCYGCGVRPKEFARVVAPNTYRESFSERVRSQTNTYRDFVESSGVPIVVTSSGNVDAPACVFQ
jgi:hypothetical protein